MHPEKLAIIEVVNNWAVWRDAGDWERFRTVWHDDGWMSATWFQGPAAAFIEVSRAGFDKGVSILHFLGGSSVDLSGTRAIAQTKMTINQRAEVDGVMVDVVCTGRFYDFFEKRQGTWGIVRRQPIYEKDRMDNERPAIVFAETASVKSEPKSAATAAFVLHEGTKVYILESIANWKKVELTDETSGWIEDSAIKEIKN